MVTTAEELGTDEGEEQEDAGCDQQPTTMLPRSIVKFWGGLSCRRLGECSARGAERPAEPSSTGLAQPKRADSLFGHLPAVKLRRRWTRLLWAGAEDRGLPGETGGILMSLRAESQLPRAAPVQAQALRRVAGAGG